MGWSIDVREYKLFSAPPNYSYYVPKTMTIPTYVFYMLRRNMPQPQCAMLTAAKLCVYFTP